MTEPESTRVTKRDPIHNTIARAVRVWSRSDNLCESPSLNGEPEDAAISEYLAERSEQFETQLLPLLTHHNALVVAYALLTLHRMRSLHLATLPPTFFERRDSLQVRGGCFTATTDFATFAHRIANGSL